MINELRHKSALLKPAYSNSNDVLYDACHTKPGIMDYLKLKLHN